MMNAISKHILLIITYFGTFCPPSSHLKPNSISVCGCPVCLISWISAQCIQCSLDKTNAFFKPLIYFMTVTMVQILVVAYEVRPGNRIGNDAEESGL